ncbi:MAG: hypothetical protein NTV21_18200 [Planctomycetota bacterium]|nr:hypothetical protein [Planctomycetota bacterium]
MKPANSASFENASASCTRCVARAETSESVVMPTISVSPSVLAGSSTSVEPYASAIAPQKAVGAAKPSTSDAQPAISPAAGCSRSVRKRYSPPERGMAVASSA